MPYRFTYTLKVDPQMPPERFTFALNLFNGDKERVLSDKSLQVMLECLFKLDVLYLQAHPETPWLYQSGVRYMEEAPGQEDWQDIPTTLQYRYGDCEDLACWRAAELVVRSKIPAMPIFTKMKRPNGSYLYHIMTKRADWAQPEDPSRILGMR